MAAESQRTARIEARISPEALKVVRRAAEMQGRSVSDFVVAAAQEVAQRAISEVEVLRLSSHAQEQFISLLLNPPQSRAALGACVQASSRADRDKVGTRFPRMANSGQFRIEPFRAFTTYCTSKVDRHRSIAIFASKHPKTSNAE